MSDLGSVWLFTRSRLAPAHEGLTARQLLWQPYVSGHCIAEYLLHIAGAEHYWAARLTGREPAATEFEAKLDRAVIDGFLEDRPFPFASYELTRDTIERALAFTFDEIKPVFDTPTPEMLEMPLVSPIGDPVTGQAGLIRLAQHAAYHTGQIWLLRQHPGFPD